MSCRAQRGISFSVSTGPFALLRATSERQFPRRPDFVKALRSRPKIGQCNAAAQLSKTSVRCFLVDGDYEVAQDAKHGDQAEKREVEGHKERHRPFGAHLR